ncbi:MAG: hypothetical protein RL115_145 [Bacteroidota bacterium]|jgi:UDP-2,3-diacylglucosamine pyrophosphatase LpxH
MLKRIRIFLFKPLLWAAKKFSSAPKKNKVFSSLTHLYKSILLTPGDKGLLIPTHSKDKFIIFSDQHKGRKDGADDFRLAEKNYLAALAYYFNQGYTFISLGDSEELWENNIRQVKKHNQQNFKIEKSFLQANRFIKVFGNHDLYWDNDPFAAWQLKNIYGQKIKVYEGIILQFAIDVITPTRPYNQAQKNRQGLPLQLLLTHGHQGDARSDGNWFSKFFVANIWAPIQSLLKINPNTPAYDANKKNLHNTMMYEWSAVENNPVLITGHTHQPVFASLTHLERLYKQLQTAIRYQQKTEVARWQEEITKLEKKMTTTSVNYRKMKPCYFNTGCCCYSDGDITGIEIADGEIRLIKWSTSNGRKVLEKMELKELALFNKA